MRKWMPFGTLLLCMLLSLHRFILSIFWVVQELSNITKISRNTDVDRQMRMHATARKHRSHIIESRIYAHLDHAPRRDCRWWTYYRIWGLCGWWAFRRLCAGNPALTEFGATSCGWCADWLSFSWWNCLWLCAVHTVSVCFYFLAILFLSWNDWKSGFARNLWRCDWVAAGQGMRVERTQRQCPYILFGADLQPLRSLCVCLWHPFSKTYPIAPQHHLHIYSSHSWSQASGVRVSL